MSGQRLVGGAIGENHIQISSRIGPRIGVGEILPPALLVTQGSQRQLRIGMGTAGAQARQCSKKAKRNETKSVRPFFSRPRNAGGGLGRGRKIYRELTKGPVLSLSKGPHPDPAPEYRERE